MLYRECVHLCTLPLSLHTRYQYRYRCSAYIGTYHLIPYIYRYTMVSQQQGTYVYVPLLVVYTLLVVGQQDTTSVHSSIGGTNHLYTSCDVVQTLCTYNQSSMLLYQCYTPPIQGQEGCIVVYTQWCPSTTGVPTPLLHLVLYLHLHLATGVLVATKDLVLVWCPQYSSVHVLQQAQYHHYACYVYTHYTVGETLVLRTQCGQTLCLGLCIGTTTLQYSTMHTSSMVLSTIDSLLQQQAQPMQYQCMYQCMY